MISPGIHISRNVNLNASTLFSRFVDFYTLPSNNFTLDANNVTYHHSRLMGASDVENAVSSPIEKCTYIKQICIYL